MLKKIGIMLSNFFISAKKGELFELIIIPLIITIALYLSCGKYIKEFDKFILSFNDTVITVTSLLAAFGLAALSILVTSSSENISFAKNHLTNNRKDRGKKPMSYYKLLVVRSFFNLFIQLGVLLLAIINKFVMQVNESKVIFYFEVFILIMAVFTQIFVVNSMYFLLETPKGSLQDEEKEK